MMRTRSIRLLAFAALLGAAQLCPRAALAQIAPQSNGPIDITSDNGSFQAANCESTWSGAAEALQGDARLRANVIRAFLKKKPGASVSAAEPSDLQANCGETDRIEADGDVYYVTPDQVARGDHAVYTADSDEIVMTGDVIVVQGKNVVRGDKMIIHVASREVEIVSNAKGRGTPGRVRGVFYPNQAGGPGLPALGH
jgi:lipopolysaccharide export system protein LptA